MNWRVQQFDGYDSLPERYNRMLEHSAHLGLFCQRGWFEYMMGTLYSDKHQMRVYGVEGVDGEPRLMMPLRYTRSDPSVREAHEIASISHLENFAPAFMLFSPEGLGKRHELMVALFRWLGSSPDSQPAPADVLRLWPFGSGSVMEQEVTAALIEADYRVQSYKNSANRYEDVRGMSYEEYFANRSANHRYNCRRRQRNLEKAGDLQFEIYTGETDSETLERKIDDYILVAAHSWKPAPSNLSLPIINMMRVAHDAGDLRLSIMRLDGVAIAAQFWILAAGVANNIRPNYRDSHREYGPGVVLTNLSIKYLMEVDGIDMIDYGFGNDDYKEKWVSKDRAFVGLMAFNRRTWLGRYHGFRHINGQTLKRVMDQLRRVRRKMLP